MEDNKLKMNRRTFVKASAATAAVTYGACQFSQVFEPAQAKAAASTEEGVKLVRTTCAPNCVNSCGHLVHVKDGRIVKVEPAEFPDPRYNRICLKGISNAMQKTYSPDRVKYPMMRVGERGEGKWKRVSWDEAYDYIAEKIKSIQKKYGDGAMSWISMTGDYGVFGQLISHRIANVMKGTILTNLGIMGDLASNVGFFPATGMLQDGHPWPDLMNSKLAIFIACNYAETALNDSRFIWDAKENGMKLIVIDPRFSNTAAKADQWVPLRPGTDAALLLGMMNVILNKNLHDKKFLTDNTTGPYLVRTDNGQFLTPNDLNGGSADEYIAIDAVTGAIRPRGGTGQALSGKVEVTLADGTRAECRTAWDLIADYISRWTPEKASQVCEVPVEVITKLAIEYATTNPAAIKISQGANRYWQGHQAFRNAILLGAICGNHGKRGGGVSWAGGTLFKTIAGTPPCWLNPRLDEGYEEKMVVGSHMFEKIPKDEPYPIRGIWFNHYNYGTQMPNYNKFINEIAPRLELIVVNEQLMNDATTYADVVLPACSWYEQEGELVASWSNFYFQLRKQCIKPMWETKQDHTIYAEISERMGYGKYWGSVEDSINEVIDNFLEDRLRDIDKKELWETGVTSALYPEDFIPFEDQKYFTKSGKLEIYLDFLHELGESLPVYVEPLESNRKPKAEKYPLTFMNVHSVFTVHSQHATLPWIQEVNPEPRVDICKADADKRNIKDGDMVKVFNDRGHVVLRARITESMQEGCVNIYEGFWKKQFKDGHLPSLTHMELNPVQDAVFESNYAPYDNLVEIEKA
ncbi:molybdopterin-dependent oxidoreductase [Syntrophomonas erecta subsp. sporosyntropha]